MVRSNPSKEIGFLCNERRMNVAVTRAKRMCVLICDSGTVNHNDFLKGLTTYFKENGISRSSFDYQGNPDIRMMYGDKQVASSAKAKKHGKQNEEEKKQEKPETAKKDQKQHMSKQMRKK